MMSDTLPRFKESYALIIDAHKLTKEEHLSLQEYIKHLRDITQDFTIYEAYIDNEYSDDIKPDEA